MFNINLPLGGNTCLNNITEQIMKFSHDIRHNIIQQMQGKKTFPLSIPVNKVYTKCYVKDIYIYKCSWLSEEYDCALYEAVNAVFEELLRGRYVRVAIKKKKKMISTAIHQTSIHFKGDV